MEDPEPEFLDDEISLASSGTGTLVLDDISDETPEETAKGRRILETVHASAPQKVSPHPCAQLF